MIVAAIIADIKLMRSDNFLEGHVTLRLLQRPRVLLTYASVTVSNETPCLNVALYCHTSMSEAL